MKLKYERFEGLGCFYVRGNVDQSHLKMLQIGLESLIQDMEEPIVINLTNAVFDQPTLLTLGKMKPQLSQHAKHPIHWVTKEKTITDFPSIELFISRLSGSKARQIGERIKLDDYAYSAAEEIKALEAKEAELEGGGNKGQAVIMENLALKHQKRLLEQCLEWQKARMNQQVKIPSNDDEINQKINNGLEELKKALGKGINL